MAKGMVQSYGGSTAGTRLREMIRTLEIDVANLQGKREKVVDALKLRDELEDEYQRLNEQGLNLRSERTRIETVDGILARSAGLIEKELRSQGGLAGVRAQVNPPEDRTWWYVDVPYLEGKRKSTKTAIVASAIIVVVLAIAFIASNTLFGPGTRAAKARTFFVNGQKYMERQDFTAAAGELEKAAKAIKNYGEAHTYLGVAYEKLGRSADAAAQFTAAQAAFKDRSKYLLNLAYAYNEAGDPDAALITLDDLLSQYPRKGEGYLARAEIYFAKGMAEEAAADYQSAIEQAQIAKNDYVFNQATLRYGIVLKTLTPEAGG